MTIEDFAMCIYCLLLFGVGFWLRGVYKHRGAVAYKQRFNLTLLWFVVVIFLVWCGVS